LAVPLGQAVVATDSKRPHALYLFAAKDLPRKGTVGNKRK
jgi:hypothetical protein